MVTTLCLERLDWTGRRAAVVHGAGLLLLVAFYVVWPGWVGQLAGYRWLQYAVGFSLLVAVLPFLCRTVHSTRGPESVV